jgi:hypothetical protein
MLGDGIVFAYTSGTLHSLRGGGGLKGDWRPRIEEGRGDLMERKGRGEGELNGRTDSRVQPGKGRGCTGVEETKQR